MAVSAKAKEERRCIGCGHTWSLDMFPMRGSLRSQRCASCTQARETATANGATIAPPRDALTGALLSPQAVFPPPNRLLAPHMSMAGASAMARPTPMTLVSPPPPAVPLPLATASPPQPNPLTDRYALLVAMLKRLPADGRWPRERIRRWLDAFVALVDEVVAEAPDTPPGSRKSE